jgi:toxin YoeB
MKQIAYLFVLLSLLTSSQGHCSSESFETLLTLRPALYCNAVIQDNTTPEFIAKTSAPFSDASNMLFKDRRQAIKQLGELAGMGHIESMLGLAQICRERKLFVKELMWNVLAFQCEWLATGQHNPKALACFEALEKDTKAKKTPEIRTFVKTVKSFKDYHPVGKHRTLQASKTISNAYFTEKIESYLTASERKTKSEWICNYYLEHYATAEELLEAAKSEVRNQRYERALFLLQRVDLPESHHLIGIMYAEHQIGKDENGSHFIEAEKHYRLANTPEAIYDLGKLYYNRSMRNTYTPDDPDRATAINLFRQSSTPRALHELGQLCRMGIIERIENRPNYEQAAKYFRNSDHPIALEDLGNMYFYGQTGDRKPNYEEAARCYGKAKTARSLWHLGTLYRDGLIEYTGKMERFAYVAMLFEAANKAAENDTMFKRFNKGKHPQALCDLATLYQQGKIGLVEGKPDMAKALRLYEEANSPEAKCNIALMHMRGDLTGRERKINFPLVFMHWQHDLRGLYYKLLLLEINEEAYINDKTNDQIVSILCDEMKQLEQKTTKPEEKECIQGVLAYYAEKDLQKALLHFNNALVLGFADARIQIKKIEQLIKLEEAAERAAKKAARAKKVATSVVDSDSSSNSFEDEVVVQKSTPAVVAIEDDRPKQYKPERATLSSEERVKRVYAKLHRYFDPVKAVDNAAEKTKAPLKINYISDAVRVEFESLDKTKVDELMEYIDAKPHATEGAGKPEVLKHKYRGCISRRIDGENRLVYKVIGPREILIYACSGHYKK